MARLTDIVLDSYNLAGIADLFFTDIVYFPRPKLETQRVKLARSNGSKLVNAEFSTQEIHLKGVIGSRLGRVGFETVRDSLMVKTYGQEKTLRLLIADVYRNYVGTVDEITFSNTAGGFSDFDIKFVCSYPFGEDVSATTILSSSSTTSAGVTKNFTTNIAGTFTAEPTITVVLSALTGGTSKYIQLTNPATTKFIKVTRTWTAADSLVVDVGAKTVKVNGTAVDYTGVFPTFEPDSSQISYADTLTTRTALISFSYKRRFI